MSETSGVESEGNRGCNFGGVGGSNGVGYLWTGPYVNFSMGRVQDGRWRGRNASRPLVEFSEELQEQGWVFNRAAVGWGDVQGVWRVGWVKVEAEDGAEAAECTQSLVWVVNWDQRGGG
eukprot:766175-Hanusia_phi.AAC.2